LQFQGRFGAPFILQEREAIEPLLERGDAALYCAKKNGRNGVEFDQAEASPTPAPAVIPALGQAVAALR
jgi:predicted signal transduction protein with EAL and GGDEF domain